MPADPKRPTPRSLVAEHARLDALVAALRSACAAGDRTEAQGCADRLEEALEAHLAREERLYFPPIAALRPDRHRSLDRLLQDHDDLRGALARLRREISQPDPDSGRRAAAELERRLALHEADEDSFLDALDAELDRIAARP